MASAWVEEFITGLHRLEETGSADALVEQFAEEATLGNLVHQEPLHGREGARHFWEGYRRHFHKIRSTFERIIETEGHAALEWHAEGTLAQGGETIRYRGVTLLRRGESGLVEFRGYYDPRPFLTGLGVEVRPAA